MLKKRTKKPQKTVKKRVKTDKKTHHFLF